MPRSPKVAERWAMRLGAGLLLAGLLALTIAVTSREDATNTESALWMFLLFAIGVGVSYYFGRVAVRDAAADIVRPQARGAARRLVTLGRGIVGFREIVELQRQAADRAATLNDGAVPLYQLDQAFDIMLFYMEGQMLTAIDALEDWREFEPDIVNSLRGTTEGRGPRRAIAAKSVGRSNGPLPATRRRRHGNPDHVRAYLRAAKYFVE